MEWSEQDHALERICGKPSGDLEAAMARRRWRAVREKRELRSRAIDAIDGAGTRASGILWDAMC